jgi:hypothetical protein
MVSITHADPAGRTGNEVRIPAGGRWMEMNWDCVARAFQAATEAVGWDADIVLTPERQHALVLFPRRYSELVAHTTSEFYQAVEAGMTVEEFMSIWIDFYFKD